MKITFSACKGQAEGGQAWMICMQAFGLPPCRFDFAPLSATHDLSVCGPKGCASVLERRRRSMSHEIFDQAQ